MPSDKRKFGDIGENRAEEFLRDKGYKILDRNYRIKNIGEIDIIGAKNGKLVFLEVKTRTHVKRQTSYPIYASIDPRKRRNLKKLCELYLLRHKQYPPDQDWQIDGLFIHFYENENLWDIEHLENIVWEEYY